MNLDTSGDTIIYGTKGSLRIPSTECWNGTIGGPMRIYHEVAGKQVETVLPEATNGGGDRPYIWRMKVRSFLDACKHGTPTPAPIDEIILNQAIISGIVESSRLGHEVQIDLTELDNK